MVIILWSLLTTFEASNTFRGWLGHKLKFDSSLQSNHQIRYSLAKFLTHKLLLTHLFRYCETKTFRWKQFWIEVNHFVVVVVVVVKVNCIFMVLSDEEKNFFIVSLSLSLSLAFEVWIKKISRLTFHDWIISVELLFYYCPITRRHITGLRKKLDRLTKMKQTG